MKALSKYITKVKNSFYSYFEKKQQQYDEETYHQLRVEIKKINALADLLRYSFDDFDRKKALKPFFLVFKKAGQIRELQLEEMLYKTHFSDEVLKEYRVQLKERLLKEQVSYFKLIKKLDKSKFKKKFALLENYCADLKSKKAHLYLKEKKKNIQKLLHTKTIPIESLHELRKQLKIYHYNQKSLAKKLYIPKKEILSVLLGEWHDCYILVEQLEQIISSHNLNPSDIKELEQLRGTVVLKRDSYYNNIIAAIPLSSLY